MKLSYSMLQAELHEVESERDRLEERIAELEAERDAWKAEAVHHASMRLTNDEAIALAARNAELEAERDEVAEWVKGQGYPFDYTTEELPPVWLRRRLEHLWASDLGSFYNTSTNETNDAVRRMVAEEGGWDVSTVVLTDVPGRGGIVVSSTSTAARQRREVDGAVLEARIREYESRYDVPSDRLREAFLVDGKLVENEDYRDWRMVYAVWKRAFAPLHGVPVEDQ